MNCRFDEPKSAVDYFLPIIRWHLHEHAGDSLPDMLSKDMRSIAVSDVSELKNRPRDVITPLLYLLGVDLLIQPKSTVLMICHCL